MLMIISVWTTRGELCPRPVNVGFALGSPVAALRSESQRFGGARHASARRRRGVRPICPRHGSMIIGSCVTGIPQAATARAAVRPNRRAAHPTQGRHADKSARLKYRGL